jgi:hypothetical protein
MLREFTAARAVPEEVQGGDGVSDYFEAPDYIHELNTEAFKQQFEDWAEQNREYQATATRLRGLLMRLRELELIGPAMHDPGECPDCDLARAIDKELADDVLGSQD